MRAGVLVVMLLKRFEYTRPGIYAVCVRVVCVHACLDDVYVRVWMRVVEPASDQLWISSCSVIHARTCTRLIWAELMRIKSTAACHPIHWRKCFLPSFHLIDSMI